MGIVIKILSIVVAIVIVLLAVYTLVNSLILIIGSGYSIIDALNESADNVWSLLGLKAQATVIYYPMANSHITW